MEEQGVVNDIPMVRFLVHHRDFGFRTASHFAYTPLVAFCIFDLVPDGEIRRFLAHRSLLNMIVITQVDRQ